MNNLQKEQREFIQGLAQLIAGRLASDIFCDIPGHRACHLQNKANKKTRHKQLKFLVNSLWISFHKLFELYMQVNFSEIQTAMTYGHPLSWVFAGPTLLFPSTREELSALV